MQCEDRGPPTLHRSMACAVLRAHTNRSATIAAPTVLPLQPPCPATPALPRAATTRGDGVNRPPLRALQRPVHPLTHGGHLPPTRARERDRLRKSVRERAKGSRGRRARRRVRAGKENGGEERVRRALAPRGGPWAGSGCPERRCRGASHAGSRYRDSAIGVVLSGSSYPRQATKPAITNRASTASQTSRLRQTRLIASRSSGNSEVTGTIAVDGCAATPDSSA